jgi:hypothetical protein
MNKKKFLIPVVVLAIAAFAAFNVNVSYNESKLSDLSLANVEALALGEMDTSECYDSIQTKSGHQVRYCGNECDYIDGIASSNATVGCK